MQKGLISLLLLLPWLENVKLTYGKSWPVNHYQVSNLTFGAWFKVKWGHHTQTAMYLLYVVTWAWNSVSRSHYNFVLSYHHCSGRETVAA